MPKFTGKSIDMSIQHAFEDAVRQAMVSKAEERHEGLSSVEVTRIYAERQHQGTFRTVHVEIEAT